MLGATLVVIAMALDFVTFSLVVPLVGGQAESNPIMRQAYAQFGLVMVGMLKAACTVALVLLVLRVHDRRRHALAVAMGVAFGFLGVFGNVTSFMAR